MMLFDAVLFFKLERCIYRVLQCLCDSDKRNVTFVISALLLLRS